VFQWTSLGSTTKIIATIATVNDRRKLRSSDVLRGLSGNLLLCRDSPPTNLMNHRDLRRGFNFFCLIMESAIFLRYGK